MTQINVEMSLKKYGTNCFRCSRALNLPDEHITNIRYDLGKDDNGTVIIVLCEACVRDIVIESMGPVVKNRIWEWAHKADKKVKK